MFKAEVLTFMHAAQPTAWERIAAIHCEDSQSRVIQWLFKEMDLRGSLDVLRNGFTDYGVKFRMAYFKPETGMNQETINLYNRNRLKVYRQVYYSSTPSAYVQGKQHRGAIVTRPDHVFIPPCGVHLEHW